MSPDDWKRLSEIAASCVIWNKPARRPDGMSAMDCLLTYGVGPREQVGFDGVKFARALAAWAEKPGTP